VFGVSNDDYDYRQVNVFVNQNIKSFVKQVCFGLCSVSESCSVTVLLPQSVCSPENIGEKDFGTFANFLRPDERAHVAVIATEARKQAELLFALRAIMVHMTEWTPRP
jgi:hypothetical protein